MSNALWMLAQTAATPPAPAVEDGSASFALSLLAAGICTLAAWLGVRLFRRDKLFLRGAPGRPNTLGPLGVLPVYVIYYAASVAAQWAAAKLGGVNLFEGEPLPPTLAIPVTIVGQVVLAIASLVLAARAFRGGLRRGLGLSGRRWFVDSVRGVIAVLAVWPVCILLLYLTRTAMPDKMEKVHPILEFIETAGRGWIAIAAVSAVILAPIAEELFFRGLLQSMLRRRFGPWSAVLISSVVFAAVHCGAEPQALPSLFALALVMGYSYERTGRLLSPMLIHALFNAANLYISYMRTTG